MITDFVSPSFWILAWDKEKIKAKFNLIDEELNKFNNELLEALDNPLVTDEEFGELMIKIDDIILNR